MATPESWKIPPERIEAIIEESEEAIWEPFPGITIMALQLPSGFVVSAHSGTIDPGEYSREIGEKCCRDILRDKVWELEGYLQKQRWAGRVGLNYADAPTLSLGA